MKWAKFLLTGVMAMVLSACMKSGPEAYKDNAPTFDLREYFDGELVAYGMLQDFAGDLNSRFKVTMKGTWQGNMGTLDEKFVFDDGRTDERIWTITVDEDGHHFTGTAADVIGEAKGKQYGNTLNMKYTLRIPRGDSTIDLAMDDWMYLIEGDKLLNLTTMKKFGLTVGKLTIMFEKVK